MSDLTNKNSFNIRFFSSSSILENANGKELKQNDPNPFGLDFQEDYPKCDQTDNRVTMSQCPTNVLGSSDSSIDLDYEF